MLDKQAVDKMDDRSQRVCGETTRWTEVFMKNYVRIEESLEQQSKCPRVVESLLEKQAESKMNNRSRKSGEEKACWVDWRALAASDGRTVDIMEDEGSW